MDSGRLVVAVVGVDSSGCVELLVESIEDIGSVDSLVAVGVIVSGDNEGLELVVVTPNTVTVDIVGFIQDSATSGVDMRACLLLCRLLRLRETPSSEDISV